MKKILFVSTNDHVAWGGSEVLWSRAAKALVREGYSVMASVWGWEPEPPEISALRAAGVLLHKRVVRSRSVGKWRRAWAMMRKGYVKEQVSNELEAFTTFHPDLVVFSIGDHFCPKFLRYAEHVRKRGTPYVVIVQLVNEYRYVDDVVAERFIAVYQGAQRACFVSEQNREILERQLAVELNNAQVIRNPVDLSIENSVPYPATDDGFYIAMVASQLPLHKGQDIAFEVLAQPKWRERPLRLNLYGGGEAALIVARLKALKALDNVNIHGHVADKGAIWRKNHAALFASRMEGQSLALLEAMAHGRMVITTDVGGARELINDQVQGFIVPFPTIASLDAVLENAWQRRLEWEAMGQQAFATLKSAVPVDPVLDLVGSLKEHMR